jgi:hypothetical protein
MADGLEVTQLLYDPAMDGLLAAASNGQVGGGSAVIVP